MADAKKKYKVTYPDGTEEEYEGTRMTQDGMGLRIYDVEDIVFTTAVSGVTGKLVQSTTSKSSK